MTKPTPAGAVSAEAAARNTDSGPAAVAKVSAGIAAKKAAQVEQMTAAMPSNPTKPLEYGEANGLAPSPGAPWSRPLACR